MAPPSLSPVQASHNADLSDAFSAHFRQLAGAGRRVGAVSREPRAEREPGRAPLGLLIPAHAADMAPPVLLPEIERALWASLDHPAAAPSDHRWGSPCHSCEVLLTPSVVDPHDDRRCRLCGVLRTLLRAQRAPSAGSDRERDRALFRALSAYGTGDPVTHLLPSLTLWVFSARAVRWHEPQGRGYHSRIDAEPAASPVCQSRCAHVCCYRGRNINSATLHGCLKSPFSRTWSSCLESR